MKKDILIFTIGFCLSVILNFLFNKWFIKKNKIDAINYRSSHQVVATKSGGISVFTGLFIFSLFLYYFKEEIFDFSLIIPLSTIFVIGVYDDFYNADFKLKFFIQIIVAKLFIDQGFVISNFYGFFGLDEVSYLLAQITTIFVFLVITNAFNFMDGIDGLAIFFTLFTLVFFNYYSYSNILSKLNLYCISSIVPLIYFNLRNENKIFIGDAGSLFFGSLVAINIFNYLDASNESLIITGNRVLIAVTVLFYPLLDLLQVFTVRILNKKSPFKPDKNHLHHILIRYTKNHFLSVIIIITFNILILYFVSALA